LHDEASWLLMNGEAPPVYYVRANARRYMKRVTYISLETGLKRTQKFPKDGRCSGCEAQSKYLADTNGKKGDLSVIRRCVV
jgi:hypothetical protein